MKRILILSDINSEHTEKWVLGLAGKGFEIGLFSFNKASYEWYKSFPNIINFTSTSIKTKQSSVFGKLSYILLLPELKRVIKKFNPDIIHAHYATSYGLLATLSRFKPFFISTWGTDVMKFPQKNIFNKTLLKRNFRRANLLLATSNTIKEYITQIIDKPVKVIPFGVNLNQFYPVKLNNTSIVIGCIKTMETIYCIDVLINAYSILRKKHPEKKMNLLLVGEGTKREQLEEQVNQLGLMNDVKFTGRIDFSHIPEYHNMIDIFVNISEYESFGVSVIEAMACEKPVVVTNVGGLKEIVDNNINGITVSVRNIDETVNAIERLLLDEQLRAYMGKNGRQKVAELYDWEKSLDEMVKTYNDFIN